MDTSATDYMRHIDRDPVQPTVSVLRGNIYLTREICETYLPAVQSVALIVRDEMLLIMPLIQESAGGLILKVRNSRGDRVIQAQEFFREKEFAEDFQNQNIPVRWSSEWAALALIGLRKNKTIVQT